jgi:ABC-type glutathione transport system ATPase component
MADPEQADKMDALVERYGEVQGRFEELDGYALDGRAREVLAGLSFSQERMDGDVGLLSGGWKMRVALARILLMRPDGMLLDEPSNHLDLESLIWLEDFLKNYEGALLMTSPRPRVHEPHRERSSRSTAARSPPIRATSTSTSSSGRSPRSSARRSSSASRRCSPRR